MFASILIVSLVQACDVARFVTLYRTHRLHEWTYMYGATFYSTGHTSCRNAQGTIVVIVGVIGIVAFGSINSGLKVRLIP